MDVFQTLQTYCGHTEDVHVDFFYGANINLTDLQSFQLSNFCNAGYGGCVINSSYSFQWMFLRLC